MKSSITAASAKPHLRAEHDAEPPLAYEPRQPCLAVAQRQGAKVLAVEFEQIEGVQHRLADGAVAVQGIEDRDAVQTADAGFAVEGERTGAQLHRGGCDRRIAAG
jgi:hypothetical protein